MLSALIVEDNASYRQSLHQLLAGRFPMMQIAEAADEEEALRHTLARRFDLVFTDIRLPRGNGLNLLKTIKTVFADSVVVVITSYNILEYRETAFQNGADHFLVKGESTEAEIVGLIESCLGQRFITLIVVSDMLSRKQLTTLLSIHWPVMIVAEAPDAATGFGHAKTLKPNLVLLELGLPGVSIAEVVLGIRAGSPQATLVGMTDDVLPAGRTAAIDSGVDFFIPLTPMGHTELVALVNSIQPGPTDH